MPSVQQSLEAVEEQLREKESDIKHLTLVAPIDGWVIPTPDVPAPPADQPDEQSRLPSWSGSPMEPKNLGATLKQSTAFCQIGNPAQMQAALVIDQSDIDLVKDGCKVVVKLDELPGDVFYSQIEKISQTPLTVSPRELSHKTGGDLQTKTDPNGVERPMNTSYEALAPIDNSKQELVVGLRGRAKISSARWLSLGSAPGGRSARHSTSRCESGVTGRQSASRATRLTGCCWPRRSRRVFCAVRRFRVEKTGTLNVCRSYAAGGRRGFALCPSW